MAIHLKEFEYCAVELCHNFQSNVPHSKVRCNLSKAVVWLLFLLAFQVTITWAGVDLVYVSENLSLGIQCAPPTTKDWVYVDVVLSVSPSPPVSI